MFKNMTLKNLRYEELENLINYFERKATVRSEYVVLSKRRSIIDRELMFEVTFPKSYVKSLPLDKAIEMILGGDIEYLSRNS